MRTLGAAEAKERLEAWRGSRVYVHFEVNPEAYLRNASATLDEVGMFGDGLYRLHLRFRDPDGLLYIQDVTEFVEDGSALVAMGLDGQNRVRQTLTVSLAPLDVGKVG
ncbi:DUF1806 family protein [Alicyclobacillus acidocaldarius]|uniref:Uncharacterized protein n=1 Tax=Alicyclobacillus acidocaldarius (strain Tc-4-1) TaxID=1048834 RepID=F8IFU5_ALIAT|nr:DUF1806 family protein [Alicyclobacillus acidocaldarius]AEJ42916.1 hypothetical protein TC41_0963 [Alicyclobacillus acidocaldarius subsp. acidocaldarius Tc-4-1]